MEIPHDAGPLADRLETIGALLDPVRRSLYLYVVTRNGDVSREEAASAVGIQRQLAAFHLDKLVGAGLLETTFRRLSGRTGPGAGRPAKLYRRSAAEHMVSLPPRKYDLAAELLAEAVEEAGDRPVREALREVARRFGGRVGGDLSARLGTRAGRERRLAALAESLDGFGYEPRRERSCVRLGNCPFHALAKTHRDLVCGMNLNLMQGMVEGMGASDLDACPESKQGDCCVTVKLRTGGKG